MSPPKRCCLRNSCINQVQLMDYIYFWCYLYNKNDDLVLKICDYNGTVPMTQFTNELLYTVYIISIFFFEVEEKILKLTELLHFDI